MKNKHILVLIVLIILGFLGYFFLIKDNAQPSTTSLLSTTNVVLTPTLSPIPTPITFKFDHSTDLKSELQTVNPKVQTSDFDKLKQIISNL